MCVGAATVYVRRAGQVAEGEGRFRTTIRFGSRGSEGLDLFAQRRRGAERIAPFVKGIAWSGKCGGMRAGASIPASPRLCANPPFLRAMRAAAGNGSREDAKTRRVRGPGSSYLTAGRSSSSFPSRLFYPSRLCVKRAGPEPQGVAGMGLRLRGFQARASSFRPRETKSVIRIGTRTIERTILAAIWPSIRSRIGRSP
jgi:hypothetical protein